LRRAIAALRKRKVTFWMLIKNTTVRQGSVFSSLPIAPPPSTLHTVYLLNHFNAITGDYDMVVDSVMCAREEDRPRFQAVVEKELGKAAAAAMDDDDDEEEQTGVRGGKKCSKKKTKQPADASAVNKAQATKAKKRAANAAKEAVEAEELLKEIQQKQQKHLGSGGGGSSSFGGGGGGRGGGGGGGGGDDLASMIRARNSERKSGFDSWAAGLEAKYAAADRKAKAKKKGKKAPGKY
jgi:uncharacterized membrane protein YgcG